MNIIREKGIVPQEVYAGLYQGMNKPMHNEMDNVLKVMLDEVNKLADGGKTSPRWKEAFNGALDGYMGKMPETFTYKGQTYTPISFMKSLGINPDDYVEISSFTHHPFYEQFALEVPDNWAWGKVYNVPLAEMEQIVDNAVNNNYSVAWASDVSEKGFSFKDGLAIVPNKDWDQMSKEERDSTFIKPIAEKEITQDIRQQAFDNQSTQDDHGMHIIGIAKDQGGKKFYLVKNSWGTEGNDLQGYFYCSAPYFQYKTTCVMVHKKAIPAAIAQKLKIKQ
jgi:bleomycin hydrolase